MRRRKPNVTRLSAMRTVLPRPYGIYTVHQASECKVVLKMREITRNEDRYVTEPVPVL